MTVVQEDGAGSRAHGTDTGGRPRASGATVLLHGRDAAERKRELEAMAVRLTGKRRRRDGEKPN